MGEKCLKIRLFCLVAFFISIDYYKNVTMRFIWDEKKNLSNIQKHKISFIQAVYVFSDPLRKEFYDEKHSSHDEDRFIVIGLAENRLLFVIFTEPEPEIINIISARKANRHERRYYGNG